MSEPKGRGGAWTKERGTSDEGRQRLEAPRRRAASTVMRRGELAAFLRSRRERITPEDVGLPGGYRRRTAGLRREEVAQLAGVGVTWYTWLEQGRPIRASVQAEHLPEGTRVVSRCRVCEFLPYCNDRW